MNRQITRLALTGVGLIVVLVVATTYWQAWAAADLADRQDNQIEQVAQFTIKRGEIRSRGLTLARNRAEKVGGRTLYFREYPRRGLAAHVHGYSTQSRFRTGLERSMNDYLTGQNANLSTVLDTTLDQLTGATITGNDLVLTLHPRAQQVALESLGSRCGAVAVIEVKTGKVVVLASSPTYDPNDVEENFDEVTGTDADCRRPDALLNRATAGLYAPGSTFKVLTAAAAIDAGRFTPSSSFFDPGYCEVYGKRVNNYDTTRPFGRLNLADALKYSVNSVFCNVGKELGAKLLVRYSKRFGFYEDPPLETPSSERAPSGLYKGTKLFDPAEDTDVDPGRFAFGQERLLVTPLQMAMLAGTIANDGVLMRPYAVDRVVAPDGSVVVRNRPDEIRRAVTPETAQAVADDDGGRSRGGHRHGGPDPGRRCRRQDGHGGDGNRRFEHDLVHRLRRARRAGIRDRSRRRAAAVDRRRDRRAGRPRRLAGAVGRDGELLTCTPMATGDTIIDTLFDGRYQIARKLGSGGMANVYLAADQELGRRVAIKILDDRHASDEQFVERFRREARNAAGLSHPNIVSIYDRGEAEGTYYIAMEYVEGRTLKELLVARGPSPIGIAIDYTRQILAALRFAHRNGIVHRDIKPHNVIVDGEGRVKVMDFGIARAGAASQMTEAGSIIGTAQYLSPEQARGAPVDQTSDLYSTGIVLYELLTGTVPFTGETPVEIAMKHLSQTPVPPSTHRPEIPRDLDYVVLRALAKDPDDRYHSAEEMDSDLERIARGIGVSAETAEAATTVLARGDVAEAATTVGAAATTYTPGRYYEYDEAPRRRAIWPWLLAALLIAGALVGGWFAWQAVQDQLSAAEPVAVPDVKGVTEQLAVADIHDAGLQDLVQREPNGDVEEGIVFEQDPQPGERIERGNYVTIVVSSGPPKTRVPDVVGQSRDAAVSTLVNAGLEANVVQVNSLQSVNTVTATDPKAGTELIEGSSVRVNVSKGPKPITVPNVIGSAYESAESQLQGVGFAVAREDVDDESDAGIVVGQNPAAGSQQPKGAVITLQVSLGPQTSEVPDVSSRTEAEATTQLETSGFEVQVVEEIVDDVGLDGLVLSQDPEGGTEADQGTTVVIVVGRFEPPPPEDTPPPTDPTITQP